MSQKTLFTKSALAVAVALISTQAWSAGFQLNEFSSSGLGRAYSGEGAIADDAGNVSRNPALITMFDRPTFSAGAVYIDPDVNISGTSPSGRSLKADNIAPTAWVPNMHFVAPINDQTKAHTSSSLKVKPGCSVLTLTTRSDNAFAWIKSPA